MRSRNRREPLRPIPPGTPDNTGKHLRGEMLFTITADLDIGGRPTQTRMLIRCTGCGAQVEVYVWSFFGGGKRCPDCRAVLHKW